MTRSSPILWLTLIIILLLPTAAGRFLLDLAGGFILILLILPFLVTGIGWLGWRFLQTKLIQCEVCGSSIINTSNQCPVCGANLSEQNKTKDSTSSFDNSIPASSATIDIIAKDAE